MKRTLQLLVALTLLVQSVVAQRQIQKVTASNGAAHDEFGASTAIDGDWAIIGSPLNDNRAFQGGAAYVFHRVNGIWGQSQELLASDGGPSDEFGYAVSISGDQAVIGAYIDSTTASAQSGSAYVFERVGSTWVERAKLIASDAGFDAQFGKAVAISGDRIAVGAWNAGASGKAYVFERSGASWNQVADFRGSDSVPGDAFGNSVAIDSDYLVVGAPTARPNPPIVAGAAYVFVRSPQGLWTQQQKLIASDGAHNDFFGDPVSISGGTIATSAPFHSSDRGEGYFFERNGSTWVQSQIVTALDSHVLYTFALASIHGDVVLGGSGQDSDAGTYSGCGYVLRRTGGVWLQTGKLMANGTKAGDFAVRLSLSGTTVLMGAPGRDEACPQDPNCESGAAYFFELAPTAIQYGSCPAAAPCNNADSHGGCRNSTGQGAILQASGSGSCTTDDLVMEVRHLPPFAPGLIFMGGAQTTTPFGSGQLVVADDGRGIYRIEIHFADADGVFLHGPGNVALTQGIPNPPGHITAGDTWNFQCWYRDQQGPCGTGFNLTNGLHVSYVP